MARIVAGINNAFNCSRFVRGYFEAESLVIHFGAIGGSNVQEFTRAGKSPIDLAQIEGNIEVQMVTLMHR